MKKLLPLLIWVLAGIPAALAFSCGNKAGFKLASQIDPDGAGFVLGVILACAVWYFVGWWFTTVLKEKRQRKERAQEGPNG